MLVDRPQGVQAQAPVTWTLPLPGLPLKEL